MPDAQNDPFAAYVVKSATSDDPFAAYEVRQTPDTRANRNAKPPSAEDFAPPQRDVSVGNMLLNAAKSIPAGIADTAKLLYTDQRPEDARLGPMQALGPLLRAAGAGAASEARKTAADVSQGHLSEAAGHAAATVLPLVGPAAASAGEDIGSGDPARIERGGGNAIGLVGSMLAPGAVAKVADIAPPLATIGEQLASKGRTVGRALTSPAAKEIVKTAAVEALAHHLGAPLGSVSLARLALKSALDGVSKAEPAATTAAEVGTLARDASGVPVKAPSVEQALADALGEAGAPAPPARITTPPPPELPPGYTPRSTVPKPRLVRPAPVQAAIDAAEAKTPPKRAYFLKTAEQIAAEADAAATPRTGTPSGSITKADLPASWQNHTGQDIFPITGDDGKAVASALADELKARKLSPGQAMALVSKNKAIPVQVRMQLLRALNGAK